MKSGGVKEVGGMREEEEGWRKGREGRGLVLTSAFIFSCFFSIGWMALKRAHSFMETQLT